MRHVWTMLCYRAIKDAVTKQTTLVDLIESLTMNDQVLPTGEHTIDILASSVQEQGVIKVPIKMEAVSQWTRSERETPEIVSVKYDILSPENKILGLAKADIDLTTGRNCRYSVNFNDFPFVGEGIYSIVVRSKGKKRWKREAQVFLEMLYGERAPEPPET